MTLSVWWRRRRPIAVVLGPLSKRGRPPPTADHWAILATPAPSIPEEPAMPKHRYLNPDKIAKPIGYTHVVEAAAPGRIIFISGQLGLDLDNRIVGAPGDFRAQAEQTFVNLANALATAGAGFEHVVKLNNYFVDIGHIGLFREVRDRFVDTAAPPASTAVAIAALARPGALIEVEAIAVVPAKAAAQSAKARGAVRRGKPASGKARNVPAG
jgi:enamine deaminase RidA (YjgF/YER057c/UK114 family)